MHRGRKYFSTCTSQSRGFRGLARQVRALAVEMVRAPFVRALVPGVGEPMTGSRLEGPAPRAVHLSPEVPPAHEEVDATERAAQLVEGDRVVHPP